MTMVIVEPHADDAFLSLGGHIEMWRKDGMAVHIVTVFSGTRKRAKDAEAYAKAVGASWSGLGFSESNNQYELDPMSPTHSEIRDAFRPVIEKLDRTYVFTPLAVRHVEHKLVREALGGLWFYLDQPYASINKNTCDVNDKIKGMSVRSYLRPTARKYRHIPLFKDQAKFFYFNPADKLAGITELIVEEPNL